MASDLLAYSPEVRAAKDRGLPIVGLETTILSFGLPRPENLQVGMECERLVREAGCVPATLAIRDGRIRIGLSEEELDFFCSGDPSIRKVNLQNPAAVLSSGGAGALTVAASLHACSLSGIRVFATGGIGGVHRGFASSLDISSDLRALAMFAVAVVCAGAKSILDIGATLELLETLGVPVVGYRTGRFPLFYARESEHVLETHFETVSELSEFVAMHLRLCASSVLVATPVAEEHAIERHQLDAWVAEALRAAERTGIRAKAVTPFLLNYIADHSGGRTVVSNRALIANNVRTACALACALHATEAG